jgi:hypothetical protein
MPTALLALTCLGYLLALAVHLWHAKRARRFMETHARLFKHAKESHDRKLADALTRANRAESILEQANQDSCDLDARVRSLARPLLGDAAVDGDNVMVPTLDMIVESLIAGGKRAEHACEELRKQVMRGSSVATLTRKSTNARADLDIDVVSIEGQPHAFTDSVLPRAKNLYRHLVATKQIQPLPRR